MWRRQGASIAVVAVTVGGLMLFSEAVPQPPNSSEDRTVIAHRIVSGSCAESRDAYQNFVRAHELTVNDLLTFVKQESLESDIPGKRRPDPLSDAYWRSVRLLTLWKVDDVIPILIRDIERRPSTVELGGGGYLQIYPNAQSLHDLSHTRTPRAILHHLDRYHAEHVTDLAIELYAILLTNPVIGDRTEWITYLEPAVKKAREESENKANFDRLLIQLEKLKRGEQPRYFPEKSKRNSSR